MGPSALYRRTGTVRSSVRSPHIVGSQRSAPRRHHCRPAPRFCSEMTSPRPVLAGLPRCGWQLSASGRCEKVPRIVMEPGRALGKGPCAEPAHEPTRSCFLTRFWPTRGSAPSTAQTSPAAPFRPSTGASGSLLGRSTTGGDGDHFIFPAACMKIEQEPRWLRMSTFVGSPRCCGSPPMSERSQPDIDML